MRKLIQLIGIPGSGKSYILKKIGLPNLNYIEFGTEFKEWVENRSQQKQLIVPAAPKKYVREFMDILINERQPAIFTSHMIYFDGREFIFDSELEMYMASGGYIHIYSPPESVMERRKRDNGLLVKVRREDALEIITKHQDLSIRLAKEYSERLGSRFLVVDNSLAEEEISLNKIRAFIQEVIFNDNPS